MARPFVVLHAAFSNSPNYQINPSSVFALMAVFSVFSSVAFLCTSSHRARKSGVAKNGSTLKPSSSRLSGRALLKMISWRKVHDEEEDHHYYHHDGDHSGNDDDDDEAIWRKTIIKGEKCRPLDFFGQIKYDSHGNLLP